MLDLKQQGEFSKADLICKFGQYFLVSPVVTNYGFADEAVNTKKYCKTSQPFCLSKDSLAVSILILFLHALSRVATLLMLKQAWTWKKLHVRNLELRLCCSYVDQTCLLFKLLILISSANIMVKTKKFKAKN